MCEESLELSDKEVPTEGAIEFKKTEAWERAYSEVKHVLATREHIPKAAERKAKRRPKGRRHKSG